MFGKKRLPKPPRLHQNQGKAEYPAPNWILQQSKNFAKEYQSVHGKPPIAETKTYETDEYVYVVKFHHNQKGDVDRTIYRKWKGSLLVEFFKKLYAAIVFVVRGFARIFRSTPKPSGMSLGNRASCPNCHRSRRRYDHDKFLKCHRCGWVIGYPVLRWIRYPTWIQHSWWWLKNRDGGGFWTTLLDLPFYPLRKIDPGWWRVLPFKRQHVLLLGFFIGAATGYLLAKL